VGRIAWDFLSLDAALDGLSVEVTKHRAGFMSPSHMQYHHYWDDLSDREIDVICGTYVLWTGEWVKNSTIISNLLDRLWQANGHPSGKTISASRDFVKPSHTLGCPGTPKALKA